MKVRWVMLALLVAGACEASAQAGWRHRRHGSSGSSGSYGSYGSGGSSGSSGSSGSYGSGGSSGSYSSGGSSGSSGSYGSGGSSGSYGSGGSSGSYSSYGSGGSGYAAASPSYGHEVLAAKPVVQPSASARLVLNVPADAVVYLVDQRMTAAGTTRQFNVPKLESGKTYGYPLRVEITRNGQKHVVNATQKIRQGDKVELVCDIENGALTLAHKNGQKNVLELTVHAAVEKLARR